jgi:hypothetical protein
MHKNPRFFPTFRAIDKSIYINYNIIKGKVQMYQKPKGEPSCT